MARQWGMAYLAGCKYPNTAIQAHPNGWAAKVFGSKVFGDQRNFIKTLISKKRVPIVSNQLLWDDKHNFSALSIAEAVNEAKQWVEIVRDNPSIRFDFSPFCEYNRTGNAHIKKALEQVKAVFGTLKNVRMYASPLIKAGGARVPGYPTELHGDDFKSGKAGDDFDYDGTTAVDSDVEKYKAKFKGLFYFWISHFNLNERTEWEDKHKKAGYPKPRPLRKCRPSVLLINSVSHLHLDRGKCSMPSRWILKSHADQDVGHTTPRGRECKPLFIIPESSLKGAKSIELRDIKGRKIATVQRGPKFRETTKDHRYIFRVNNWGYRISNNNFKRTGSHLTYVYINGVKKATVSLGFRFGTFRSP